MIDLMKHLLGLCGEATHLSLLHVLIVIAALYAGYIVVDTFKQFKQFD